ncbi:hypothetical protein BJV82DRAFT_583079 [Fennellomyces sp. T-0311]|nr:hypothetical protein BJV82DRAFT_583079 [Fennellomyces sp. T-0311]
MFNADTLDTFCFRWPAANCFVLVRVLHQSIALLPLRSRRAFLYFHNAPLPHQPTFLTVVRKPSRIHTMFSPWRNTLALSEQSSMSSDEEVEEQEPCTLANVLHDLPHETWVHAPCCPTASDVDDRTVFLSTANSVIALEARSSVERRMFLNLVRLEMPTTCRIQRNMPAISTQELVQRLQKRCQGEAAEMLQLAAQVTRAKKEIVSYTDHLTKLNRSCTALAASLHEYQAVDNHHLQVLHSVKKQVEQASVDCNKVRHRLHRLDLWLGANPDLVGAARLRLMLDVGRRTPRWYWMFTDAVAIFVVGLAVAGLWK